MQTYGRDNAKTIKAPTGTKLSCKGWRQEAILRMLFNNIENAEVPEELIVYGGRGKAARNWECFNAIVKTLQELEDDETMLVQSGKPVGVFKTHKGSPRVLICNSNLVPFWSTFDNFIELEKKGLMMYGQMTAGSWCYIGTQGIIQGTFETFAAVGRAHFKGDLSGRFCLTGGCGGMGGAQPLAIKMAGGSGIIVDVDRSRIQKRLDTGYCDEMVTDLDEALKIMEHYKKDKKGHCVGLVGNAADIFPKLVKMGKIPDVVTDQTSAHDPLYGYVPNKMTLKEAIALRKKDPAKYKRESFRSMKEHCKAMVQMKRKGAVVFDYGNNLRGQAKTAGLKEAFEYPGFVVAYIRPMFCEGRGPFRWLALSGDPEDIKKTDEVVMREFKDNKQLVTWIKLAQKHIKFQGLPARVCWLGYGERAHFAKLINKMVRDGVLKAPIAITRDHLDCGSVASPNRETEGMKDGTDAVADWPLLNALVNCAAGADSVQIHNGGGVGIGLSTHAGMVVVADGTPEADERIERVFTTDPGMGILRHVDAGYDDAVKVAKKKGVKIPMMK
jgi:urocanate hydratase